MSLGKTHGAQRKGLFPRGLEIKEERQENKEVYEKSVHFPEYDLVPLKLKFY